MPVGRTHSLMTKYHFKVDARGFGKQNLAAVGAFAFAFFFLEAALVRRWLQSHPHSFWWVNGLAVCFFIFFFVHWLRHLGIKGAYEFVISDSTIASKSPHPLMGQSFSIRLNDISKLEHLYFANDGVRNESDNIFRIHYGGNVATLREYPGHKGTEVFRVILGLRPDLVIEERLASLGEAIELGRDTLQKLLG